MRWHFVKAGRKGPILTRLDVEETWQNASAMAGVLDDYLPETTIGGHAVALVGYRPGRFIVRNSWGTATAGHRLGRQGFVYASLAYAQQAFTEAYGRPAALSETAMSRDSP